LEAEAKRALTLGPKSSSSLRWVPTSQRASAAGQSKELVCRVTPVTWEVEPFSSTAVCLRSLKLWGLTCVRQC